MPKRKPDQVITHRIELGTWERDNIATPVASSKQVSNLANSVSGILVAGGLGLAAYGLYWFFDAGWGIRNEIRNYWIEKAEAAGISEQEFDEVTDKAPWSDKVIMTILGIKEF